MTAFIVLGELIKVARQQQKLDQSDLAAQLGVRQQAISGWERGASRPRLNQLSEVCAILGVDLQAATEAGRYREPTVVSGTRLLVLPFENLTDEAFEAFCRDMFAFRHPEATVTRNGSTGQKQFGVDVFIDHAENRVGVQCKRRENFGAADIQSVIDEVMPEASVSAGVIALSRRTASAAARKEMVKHSDWTLLDGEDLSRMVRELPTDRAVTLIDTYFNGLRERFLGVREPSPWLTVTQFDPALPGRLAIERNFSLIGRDEELERLSEMLSSHMPLILLVGRGGIGKTRLLRELALTYEGREIRFVRPGAVSPESFEHLPDGAPVIVVDDATDTEYDLAALLNGILRERPDATVVLAARPRSLPHLLAKLDLPESEAKALTVELGDLAAADAERLASEALGDAATQVRIERLAAVGYDCPFLIVIAAHLIRSGKLSDRGLGTQTALRREILTRFANIVVSGSKADERTRVLSAVAAVQPAPLDDPSFLETIADLSRLDVGELLNTLDELEDLGLILRREKTIRVVPDLLGDSLLDRALVSDSGIDKGFASRIANGAMGRVLTNAIRNVSIIDWRRRADGPSDLAEGLWAALTKHALTLRNSERIALGRQVGAVAAIYPQQALDLVDAMMASPAPDEDDAVGRLIGDTGPITKDSVMLALAPLIANAGHNSAHLQRAMALLLRAGSLDSRPEHRSPDHPLRLLRELGEYSSEHNVDFYLKYVENVAEFINAEDDAAARAILVELLKPALAHQFTVTRFRRISLTMARHTVNFDSVAEVRAAAIDAATEATSDALPVAHKAIDVLAEALHSHDPADEATEEFASVVGTLRLLLRDAATAPGIRLAAFSALGWHATHGRGPRRELARAARADLLRDDAYLIARQVRSGWDVDEDEDEDGSNAVERYHRAAQLRDEAIDDLVDRWIARGEEAALLSMIRSAMDEELVATGRLLAPDRLLLRLMSSAPKLATATLVNRRGQETVEDALVGVALRTLIETSDPIAESFGMAMLDANSSDAQLAASAVLGARAPMTGTRERLLRHGWLSSHPEVHRILLSLGRWLEPEDRGIFLEMLNAAPIESDPEVANVAVSVLAYGRAVSWESLPPSARARFLERLVETPKLPDHELGVLLNAEIKVNPQGVVALFKARVDRRRTADNYDVFPYLDAVDIDFGQASQLAALIDDVVEWILTDDSWDRRFYGEQLLEKMLGDYGDEAKALLKRLIVSQDEERLHLARKLLGDAPRDFVIRDREFVFDLIELADRSPDELGKHVIAGLHGSARYGMRSRSIGVDDPEEVALRDEGTAIAQSLPKGSSSRSFFEDVARYAAARLAEERADDRSLEEPRQW